MTDFVDPNDIERIVGAKRDLLRHMGRMRAVDETFYILHSQHCLDRGFDLRDCIYSRALDVGLNLDVWLSYAEQPVELAVGLFDGQYELLPSPAIPVTGLISRSTLKSKIRSD